MNVAVIPARSGSKGVPDKNLLRFRGRSLIAHAALVARATDLFDEVILSTDSERYAEEGRRYCSVPYLRPAHLADDASDIRDVLADLLERLDPEGRWDTLTLLEPSCPLRTAGMVRSCASLCLGQPTVDASLTISLVPPQYHAWKQFRLEPDGSASYLHPEGDRVLNRQRLPQAYRRNGAAYVFRAASLRASRQLFQGNVRAVVLTDPLISIDSPEDVARLLAYDAS